MKVRYIGVRLGDVSVSIEYENGEDYINDGETAKFAIKQMVQDHFDEYIQKVKQTTKEANGQ